MSGVESLRALAKALLSEPLRPTAADELYALLARESFASDDTSLPDGSALSPARAADCTRDLHRTATFLRGLHDAIAEARRRFGGVVEVLYAGTGPLAPLALPLMTLIDDVRFTLVDIHAESIEHVRSLIERFALEGHVRDIVQADATRYEPRVQPHVAVAETMRRSLAAEPQVAIARQLSRVLGKEGILVPERIAVHLDVAERAATMRWLEGGAMPERTRVATLLELTRESDSFAPVRVQLPEGVAMLTTTVEVYGEHRLRDASSGLTTPEVLWELRGGERVEFRYVEGSTPRMTFTRVT